MHKWLRAFTPGGRVCSGVAILHPVEAVNQAGCLAASSRIEVAQVTLTLSFVFEHTGRLEFQRV
jgi:hypothetical protein